MSPPRGSDEGEHEVRGETSTPPKELIGPQHELARRDDGMDDSDHRPLNSIQPREADLTRDQANTSVDNEDDRPSNERLLGTAFISFMTFALTQLLFAFIAGSEAMMGDSAAMIVDAITYLFNWIAERRKNTFDEHYHESIMPEAEDPVRAARIHKRNKRKMVLQLEIVPPVISVTTLVIVTILVTKKAVGVLVLDMHRSRDEQRIPNINLMLGFSIFNLALDGLNVFCFARAKHLMGYATVEENDQGVDHHHHHHATLDASSNGSSEDRAEETNGTFTRDDSVEHDAYTDLATQPQANNGNSSGGIVACSAGSFESNHSSHDDEHQQHANLNMCSAYTHVFADTLRSIAVIIAACVAEIVPKVTPEEADATAAVVVSFLILLSLMPLIQGLLRSVSELRSILAEEKSEVMFRTLSDSFELT